MVLIGNARIQVPSGYGRDAHIPHAQSPICSKAVPMSVSPKMCGPRRQNPVSRSLSEILS